MTPAIAVHQVSVNYGEVQALVDTSLLIRPGVVTALIGMNGSGKSTLLNGIIGSVPLAEGRIELFGQSPNAARVAGRIGYLPQSENVDWSLPVSVWDVAMMGRHSHTKRPTRRPAKSDFVAVGEALERVGLSTLAQRQIGQLSGGQRKRAFMARSIAQTADVLLLDEPFAGVDKTSEATMSALIRDLARDGVTVVVSTHDLHALPQLADEAILLRNRPIFQGSVMDALKPENLARAFGLDDLDEGGRP